MAMGTRQLELLVKERYRSGTLTIKDALQIFDHLLVAKNPAPSIYSFNQLFTALTRMNNTNNTYEYMSIYVGLFFFFFRAWQNLPLDSLIKKKNA